MRDDAYFRETAEDSRLIFDGRVLHLYRDSVRLPGGGRSVREYCRHGGAVAVVPLTAAGEVVCVRQYRYALGRVTLEIPAGKLDSPAEDRGEAALRELREETGYRAARLRPLGDLASSPALLDEIIRLYLAEDLTPGTPQPDEDERLETVRIPLDDLMDRILSGEVRDAKTQAAVAKVWVLKHREAERTPATRGGAGGEGA